MKSGIAPLILIIIIGIVLAAGGLGLGLAWKAGLIGKPGGGPKDGTTTNGTQPTPPPQPPPSNGEEAPPPPLGIPADWKAYSVYWIGPGFSLKYPPDWKIDEGILVGNWYLSLTSPDYVFDETGVGEVVAGMDINVSYAFNAENKTPQEWLSENWDPVPYTIRKDLTVDGYPTVEFEMSLGTGGGLAVIALVAVGDRMYDFTCRYPFDSNTVVKEECARTLELVLSSVKFE